MIVLTCLQNDKILGVYPENTEIHILSNGYPYIVTEGTSFPPEIFKLYYGVEDIPDEATQKYCYSSEMGFYEFIPYGLSEEQYKEFKDSVIEEVLNDVNPKTEAII